MNNCKICGEKADVIIASDPYCNAHQSASIYTSSPKGRINVRADRWLKNQQDKSHFTLDTIIYGISKQPFEFTVTEHDTETIIAYLAADFEKEQQK